MFLNLFFFSSSCYLSSSHFFPKLADPSSIYVFLNLTYPLLVIFSLFFKFVILLNILTHTTFQAQSTNSFTSTRFKYKSSFPPVTFTTIILSIQILTCIFATYLINSIKFTHLGQLRVKNIGPK